MEQLIQIACLVAIIISPLSLPGQLVCSGDACSCDKEADAPPNLSIAKPVEVQGVLLGEWGNVFSYEDTFVQVRNQKTKAVLISAPVDAKGHFDLGVFPAGEFRLIAARKKKDGTLERQPLADQPKSISCSGESTCWIEAIQHIHGSDLPFEFCPPK